MQTIVEEKKRGFSNDQQHLWSRWNLSFGFLSTYQSSPQWNISMVVCDKLFSRYAPWPLIASFQSYTWEVDMWLWHRSVHCSTIIGFLLFSKLLVVVIWLPTWSWCKQKIAPTIMKLFCRFLSTIRFLIPSFHVHCNKSLICHKVIMVVNFIDRPKTTWYRMVTWSNSKHIVHSNQEEGKELEDMLPFFGRLSKRDSTFRGIT